MNTKHTPGPWNAVITETGMAKINGGPSTVQSGEPYQVGWVIVEEHNKTARLTDVANAHLIAAAPDLLEACKALLFTNTMILGDQNSPSVHQARKAISKAEGFVSK